MSTEVSNLRDYGDNYIKIDKCFYKECTEKPVGECPECSTQFCNIHSENHTCHSGNSNKNNIK